MELKDFIKATITGIVSAVDELNNEFKDIGAIVDPHRARFEGNIDKMVYNEPGSKFGSLIHEVEFSLTVAEMKQSSKDGGIKIKVIDAKIESATGKENLNTVKFSIPVVYSTKSE